MFYFSPRSIKRLLWLATVFCVVGAITVIAWPFPQQNTETREDLSATNSVSEPPIHTASQQSSRNSDSRRWPKQLQRPLFDPPPPAPAAAPPPPPLRIQLIGTVISGDRHTAMIQTPREGTQLVAVGQIVDDAELLRIDANQVTVLYHGEERILEQAAQ